MSEDKRPAKFTAEIAPGVSIEALGNWDQMKVLQDVLLHGVRLTLRITSMQSSITTLPLPGARGERG